jgi:hypothetical protein
MRIHALAHALLIILHTMIAAASQARCRSHLPSQMPPNSISLPSLRSTSQILVKLIILPLSRGEFSLIARSFWSHCHQTTVLSKIRPQCAQLLRLSPPGEYCSMEAAAATSGVLSYRCRPFKAILNELLIINYKLWI